MDMSYHIPYAGGCTPYPIRLGRPPGILLTHPFPTLHHGECTRWLCLRSRPSHFYVGSSKAFRGYKA